MKLEQKAIMGIHMHSRAPTREKLQWWNLKRGRQLGAAKVAKFQGNFFLETTINKNRFQ
jgi:hypothetical protein